MDPWGRAPAVRPGGPCMHIFVALWAWVGPLPTHLVPAPPPCLLLGPHHVWSGPPLPSPSGNRTETPNRRLRLQYSPKCTRSVDAYQWIGKQAAYSLGPLLGPCLRATRQVATGSIGPARLRCLTAANAHVGRQPTPGEQAQTGPAAWQELRTCAQPSGSDTVLCLFLSHNSPMPIR